MPVDTSPSARQRILTTAYDLFTRRGIRDVGVDEVVQKAAVAKTTLYRHFPSKDDLVIAFLAEREQQWTVEVVEKQSYLREDDPEGRLLAIFDVFDDWFAEHSDFESCSFVKVLLEMGAEGRIGEACIAHLAAIRGIVAERARLADLRDVEEFTLAFNVLMKGSIIAAAEGDRAAARRAKPMAASLIDRHRAGA
ncbi:TetR/AcrR family transcriptional regulator [Mycolicibacterium psychrotolerans]|uniref:TetR family transcriptional regulator n=1 Tax=Mycolicibacterium psychrotolerans TaxID=216929 RepID=A0A7I7M7K4_9MYCO|nr:TetR/AcrR family transcriptional regulator [Mycolicibacterium psychrotolerans]BBX67523.1 TetR family transcriptional regulator [Mycolicibacterium psychrotolerans]